ncbi:hypothetical protein AGABI2DRAFT_122777 [Agaricus bisporus var. bisporus H97]|uniref:hypothetical protein n=1 Tax=Agaricus bisporus var. bisporus (strain H97 / ATCC MYA-4626 / FGSC 10389) TaxID=936046 RepID=UPI00029F7C10|nr:hypothetical protein AGABI2DRAFT_122777 [Agaricus bisporus var. bisporus H97]EKV42558.1 hypothetical protein AGABI2DRAFT_122777 [Agaricus bisporus var. bisporus H97]
METLLTEQLNELLSSLNLPFALQSPAELTPSLLLAVLEAILDVRIPVDVHDPATRHIQTIKVFLGVLETDIIRSDVGLSQIDPRLLAAGEWDEIVFVAEVLCWIGKELGLIHDKSKDPEDDRLRSVTPSPSSTITFLPPFSPISPLFTPTLLLSTADDDTLQTNITSPLATSFPYRHTTPPPHHHHKTHSHIPPDDSSFTRQSPPIRRTGHISLGRPRLRTILLPHSFPLPLLSFSSPNTHKIIINNNNNSLRNTLVANSTYDITRSRPSQDISPLTTTYSTHGRTASCSNDQ